MKKKNTVELLFNTRQGATLFYRLSVIMSCSLIYIIPAVDNNQLPAMLSPVLLGINTPIS